MSGFAGYVSPSLNLSTGSTCDYVSVFSRVRQLSTGRQHEKLQTRMQKDINT
jgi:hypothetical protein